jgi:hypothetical protein
MQVKPWTAWTDRRRLPPGVSADWRRDERRNKFVLKR